MYFKSTGLKPPSKSAESVFWFKLNTCNYLFNILAISYTAVVLPVPVSPTSSTVSPVLILVATCSSSRIVKPVYTKLFV